MLFIAFTVLLKPMKLSRFARTSFMLLSLVSVGAMAQGRIDQLDTESREDRLDRERSRVERLERETERLDRLERIEKERERERAFWYRSTIDQSWYAFTKQNPRVIGFSIIGSPFAITGPYFGYVFSENFELGVTSKLALTSGSVTAGGKATYSSYDIGFAPNFTATIPLDNRFIYYLTVAPGFVYQKTQTGDNYATNGVAFSIDFVPVGIGIRINNLEFRSSMKLSWQTGGYATNAGTGTHSGLAFDYGVGLLDVRYRY